MLKRFCEVCNHEIKADELYFDLTPERCGNAIIGVDDDEQYAKTYIHNHANLCSKCFKDIFLRHRYPIKDDSALVNSQYPTSQHPSSGRYPWKENK